MVVSSIFGTNSIEGGALSEEETQLAMDLDPVTVRDTEQRRALNIKAAYDLARDASSQPHWQLDLAFIQALHAGEDSYPISEDIEAIGLRELAELLSGATSEGG